MSLIWSDFDPNSLNSQKMIKAKQVNGPDYWSIMREVFAYDCGHLPFTRFRLWASVHNVPFVTQYQTSRFLGEAFYWAAQNPDVANALKENWIGIPFAMRQPLLVSSDFDTSMQRVQDIAHLMITNFGKKELSSYKSIIEIGAGYGNMCSVAYAMGFRGKYTIVDIPETRPIQDYYLKTQGINANFSFEDDNVEPADLVISTWALSETPLDYRARLIPKIEKSKNWLILSQARVFGQEVNFEYFDKFFANKNAHEIPLVSAGLNAWDGGNKYYVVKN